MRNWPGFHAISHQFNSSESSLYALWQLKGLQFHMWRSKPAREKTKRLDQSVSRVCHVGPLGVSMCNCTASNVIVLSNTDICHTSLHWLDFSPIMGAQLHPSSFSVKSSDIRSTLSAALVQLNEKKTKTVNMAWVSEGSKCKNQN